MIGMTSCKKEESVEPNPPTTPTGPIVRTLTASGCAEHFTIDGLNAGDVIQAYQGEIVEVRASCNPAVVSVFGVGTFEHYGFLGPQGIYIYYFEVP